MADIQYVQKVTRTSSYGNGGFAFAQVNPRQDTLVAQALPERSDLVRMGRSWGVAMTTATAFTFVAAWPTTRSELVLSNGEKAGGASYLIDRVWLGLITSTTAAQPITLLGQITPVTPVVAAIAAGTPVFHSLSGLTNTYTGAATAGVASTAFALANQWFVLGTGLPSSPATTNLMNGVEAFVYGRYVIPPGASFSLAGVSSAATGTAIVGIEWHEVALGA